MEKTLDLVTEVARKLATRAARVRAPRRKVTARSKTSHDQAAACKCHRCGCPYNAQR